MIELLVVVAIFLIIAAIAIPNLLRARMVTNEAATVTNLRTIGTAQVVYFGTYNQGYASTLAALGPEPGGGLPSATAAGLIDDVLATGAKSGYGYGESPCAGSACSGGSFTTISDGLGKIIAFSMGAGPSKCERTGRKNFFIDESEVIRNVTDCNLPAGATSSAL